MQVKLFEVRDRATAIPCFGILMTPGRSAPGCPLPDAQEQAEEYLLMRSGYGFEYPLVLFGRLEGGETNHDPFNWRGLSRTMPEAHRFITLHWKDLESGTVIDVEYILGETKTSKVSERVS